MPERNITKISETSEKMKQGGLNLKINNAPFMYFFNEDFQVFNGFKAYFCWAAIALGLIFIITCMICVFKKRRAESAKRPKGKTGKQNMANVFNVVVVNDRKIFNPKMAGKAKRLEVKPLLRVSESSCGSDQHDFVLPKTSV